MLHFFKKHNTANDTAKEICIVYDATGVQAVRSWFRKFRANYFNLEDRNRPSTSDTNLIEAIVE